MASRKETPRTESSTNIKPKVSAFYDEGDVFTVEFTDNEERSWTYVTEWTCIPTSGECEIILTRRINEHLCNMMRHFDRPPNVKLTSLRNPQQKVILVFGHDTEANAFNMFRKYTDVRSTVVSFLQKEKIPMEDIKVRVRLTRTGQSTGQQDKGYNCIFDPTPDYPEEEKSETTWFCIPDNPNLEVDNNEASNSEFTRFKENIRNSFRAVLRRVSTGSVIFTFHHGSTEDALEMISKHDEVRAKILECLQGIDSTVKEIQMEVQLQVFIDPRSLPEHGDQDKRYVDKQEHDKEVKDLSEQVATLTLQLQEMKEKEQAQLADFRLSMWKTRPGSPQPSESSGFFTTTDTMTDVCVEEFQDTTDLSEPEGGHRQGGASKPRHTSGTVTHLRRQLADMKQELEATTERMHRLEIAQSKGNPGQELLQQHPPMAAIIQQ
ncbi:uncharacterized protein LOC124288792 isoform X2 [Haliotis rubra]|uniref:uncharacterized protein LOC124288792 isoform X2 n=1 Tax=Haliotis rubra TaxID=36100 RepID=UPI001EE5C5FF|nr:uncharacterized protein LOC124288792 isoform X2 [Haliotis rubra]